MKTLHVILGVIFFMLLLCFVACVFTVQQGQEGIVLRLGRLVQDAKTGQPKILGPGLHFKAPFVEQVRVFDTRLQTLDSKPLRIVTNAKKDVIVDYYMKWRVANLAQYFKATDGNPLKAETLLEQQLNTSVRAEFGKRELADISGGRDDIMTILRTKTEEKARKLGVRVVDVRIKGIELPESTSQTIFERMRADRQAIANGHRANGHANAEEIKAGADAKARVIMATAQQEGQAIRAQGQAKAAQIFAEAGKQNPEFFTFYLSLKAYENSFNTKQDLLVLDQSSAFFEYFKHPMVLGDRVAATVNHE